MLNSIKKYLVKAKEEVSREYMVGSSPDRQAGKSAGKKGWIGVDLDGTLARDDPANPITRIGDPVPLMLQRVKKMIEQGVQVKIFTARASDTEQLALVRQWLLENGLPELEITNVKDFGMLQLYDDRCVQVERNTGRLIMEK